MGAVKSIVIVGAIIVMAAPAVSAAEFFHVNAYLCETPEYAIKFAAVASRVDQDEEASAIVGRAFNREVCGKYIGFASVDKRETVIADGIAYKIIALRFKEDDKVAWAAEPDISLEPSSGAPKPP